MSDHAPVLLELELSCPPQWAPRPWFLSEVAFCDLVLHDSIRGALELYFQENDSGEVSTATLWDAARAVIRRELLSHTPCFRKLDQSKKVDLEAQLQHLKALHQATGSART